MSNESHCLHIRQGSRVAALCLAVALSGCIASTRNPDRLIPVAAEMDFLAVDQSRLIANYDRAMASADFVGARTIRNDIITQRMYAIDVQSTQYETARTRERQEVGFGT